MMNMPPVTKNLIIINVLFFLGKLVATRYGVDLDDLLGLHFFLAPDFLDRADDIFRQMKRFADFVNYTIDDFE